MAMRFSLFKTPRHRVFEYQPRYVDEKRERKEELEKLVEDAKTGRYNSKGATDRIKNGLRSSMPGFQNQVRKHALNQRIRFGVIAGFISAVLYLIFT
jgi:hypothetical protein